MDINIKSNAIVKFLFIIAILLIIIHSSILVIYYTIGDPDTFDFVRMFDLDMERNVPTLFSSALMLIAAVLFYLLAESPEQRKEGARRYWIGLSLVFVFLAFDESAKIHEQLGDFTENFVEATGYLHYPWIISYSILVFILGLFYAKFFWRMESKIFWSFVTAAVLFLGGAVGFELLGAKESSMHGTNSLTYSVLYTIEESLEMFGVIYLIHTLLQLLEGKIVTFK